VTTGAHNIAIGIILLLGRV